MLSLPKDGSIGAFETSCFFKKIRRLTKHKKDNYVSGSYTIVRALFELKNDVSACGDLKLQSGGA
jgi:hypothetical protein